MKQTVVRLIFYCDFYGCPILCRKMYVERPTLTESIGQKLYDFTIRSSFDVHTSMICVGERWGKLDFFLISKYFCHCKYY